MEVSHFGPISSPKVPELLSHQNPLPYSSSTPFPMNHHFPITDTTKIYNTISQITDSVIYIASITTLLPANLSSV